MRKQPLKFGKFANLGVGYSMKRRFFPSLRKSRSSLNNFWKDRISRNPHWSEY